MKNLATGIAFLGVLAMANVVAAGVMLVLGQAFAEPFADEQHRLFALALCGLVGLASALLFLRGCLTLAAERLQCHPARRGG